MSPRPAAIVTDIEGTTSRISFVHDVLFPYARARLPAFLAERGAEPEAANLTSPRPMPRMMYLPASVFTTGMASKRLSVCCGIFSKTLC